MKKLMTALVVALFLSGCVSTAPVQTFSVSPTIWTDLGLKPPPPGQTWEGCRWDSTTQRVETGSCRLVEQRSRSYGSAPYYSAYGPIVPGYRPFYQSGAYLQVQIRR